MKNLPKILVLALLAATGLTLAGCQEKSPAEKVTDAVTDAAKDAADATKDAAKKAAEATKDAAEKAADAVKDAVKK